jgi:small subunit ribosomal protein S1
MEKTEAKGRENGMEMDMGALLDEYDFDRPQRGRFVQGEVVHIEETVAFVDIGAKHDAVVTSKDLNQLDEDFLENISVGDEIPVYVTETPGMDGDLRVSIEKGLEQTDWKEADQLLESGELTELAVSGQNRGGLLVDFGRLQGCVPNSLIPDIRRVGDPQARRSVKEEMSGQNLLLQVIEVDRKNRRLVLSARAARAERRQRRLQELTVGETLTGRVTNLVQFGAFVDLGGVDGLVHISNLAWRHVDHPSEVLERGDEVEVLIESVDIERERVGLNRKVLLPNPVETFEEEHHAGDFIEGTVTDVKDFGAFIELEDDVVGLVHVSEMPSVGPEISPEDVLQPGDEVTPEILEIDVPRERVRLSLRRHPPEED